MPSLRTPRRDRWRDVPPELLRGFIADDLDEIEHAQEEHEDEDRKAFAAVRSQNRWIATLVVGAIVQLALTLAVILVTSR